MEKYAKHYQINLIIGTFQFYGNDFDVTRALNLAGGGGKKEREGFGSLDFSTIQFALSPFLVVLVGGLVRALTTRRILGEG